jgi:outer membrane murein-binding lipoprotein Lpp
MTFHHYHHFDDRTAHLLQLLLNQGDMLMATMKEVTDKLTALAGQVGKIDTEVQGLKALVATLQTTIANGPPITPELQAAVDAVAAAVQRVDDEIPDAPPTP